MKTTINRLFILIIATTLITLATACDSSTLRQVQEDSNTEAFIINGTISLNANAMPKEFINQNTAQDRSATSSFKPTNNKNSYSVIAVQGQKTVNATISNSKDNVSYSLSLNSRGTWIIKVSLYYEEILVAQAEDEEVTISETLANGTIISSSKLLTVTPQIDSSKKGAINLAIKNQVSDTSTITWHWLDEAKNGTTKLQDQTKTLSSSNQVAEFTYESVNSGSYNVEIIFKDSTGKLLYSCYEAINVFANWTTDTWCGKSPYLNDKNEFIFDDTVKAAFGQSKAGIENTADAPLFLLWSEIPNEASTEGPTASNKVGSQVFNSITEGMTITNAMNCGYYYCFDEETLYAPPYRYIKSYSGFARDSSFDLNEFIPAQDTDYSNCCFVDDFVYFIFSMSQAYFIGRYNTKDNTTSFMTNSITTSFDYNYKAIAVTHTYNSGTHEIDSSSGVLYIAVEEVDSKDDKTYCKLYRKPFIVEYNDTYGMDCIITEGFSLEEDDIKPADIDINDFDGTFELRSSYLSVTDMTIIGDRLYALVATEGLTTDGDQVIYTKNTQEEYEPSLYGFRSNGGILQFDVTSDAAAETSFVPLAWNTGANPNTNDKIFGLYTLSKETAYYANYSTSDSDPADFRPINTTLDTHDDEIEDLVVPVQPPLTQANNYFYGPRKILVTKTNQLIIVDDGGYFEATGFIGEMSKSFKPIMQIPKNRIVTVDLQNPAITSVVDVSATFTSKYRSDKFYFSTSQN